MATGPLIAAMLFVLVGLSVGLLGSGGSVLTVPILMYTAGFRADEAIAASLLIVGSASALSAVPSARQGRVNGRLTALFVVPGIVTSFAGARVTPLVEEHLLLSVFGGCMIAIGCVLAAKAEGARSDGAAVCRAHAVLSTSIGALLGFLTGLLGVGGGFLIVPAIALLMKCSLRTAIGTSSAIIAVNSLAGFAGHASAFEGQRLWVAVYLSATLLGARLAQGRSEGMDLSLLQKILGVLVAAVGAFLVIKSTLA